MNLSSGSTFFLISKPELSGSPPRRAAPPVGFPVTFNHSCTSEVTNHLDDKEIERSGTETIAGEFTSVSEPCKLVKDANVLTLGLPSLSTGSYSLFSSLQVNLVILVLCSDGYIRLSFLNYTFFSSLT